jgi:DNA polymerase-3 subunit epsilon
MRATIRPPMHPLDAPLAFVDLETTGTHATYDRITEVGIVTLTDGVVEEWSSLVDPGCRIPPAIESLTGITSEMVAGAPEFAQLADEVLARLAGRLFIAHNARFDYGFLKAAFARLGLRFQPKVLCTARLSRRLSPGHQRHNLDALIGRYGIDCAARHRALGDARVLVTLLARLRAETAPEALEAAIAHQLKKPSLPPQLAPDALDALPEAPGVYLFHDAAGAPLYVGKSVNIRNRVASHFSADLREHKEMQLARQVSAISFEVCAGELSALLRESRLIKELAPVYNRRLRHAPDLHTLHWDGVAPPEPQALDPALPPDPGALYGVFRTRREAKNALVELADEHGLCRKRLGMEGGTAADGRPCFARQLGRCKGVCMGLESPAQHDLRLATALVALRLRAWPFAGRIGLREGDEANAEVHVFDRWRYVATARGAEALAAAWCAPAGGFDLDTYKILLRQLDLHLKKGGRFELLQAPPLPPAGDTA